MPYVRTRLGRWFYEERGKAARPDAPTVVLWHSLLCDGGMWRGQIEPLSALGRVVSFDGPGHGKSEQSPSFTLEENADALVDGFRELRIERAVMVGLSWGGMLAMRLALQHPTRVRALALLDTSAEAEEPARALKYRLLIAFSRHLGMPKGLADTQIVPLMLSSSARRREPELANRLVRAANGFSREGSARAAIAVVVRRTDILGRIAAIRAPTLVMCGTEDRSTEPVHSQRIADQIPGARLVLVEGAGHLSALEQPAKVNESLVPFVREHLA
ncbi:MAG: alpha/beta fold hydrolase [Polyangiaceae bacterium]|jgi:3-oxoadipate enol-lactonase